MVGNMLYEMVEKLGFQQIAKANFEAIDFYLYKNNDNLYALLIDSDDPDSSELHIGPKGNIKYYLDELIRYYDEVGWNDIAHDLTENLWVIIDEE